MEFVFETQELYKISEEFTDKVLFLTQTKDHSPCILTFFLKESALRVCLNIAESCASGLEESRCLHLTQALASCYRCVPLVSFLRKQGTLSKIAHISLKSDIKTLITLIHSAIPPPP